MGGRLRCRENVFRTVRESSCRHLNVQFIPLVDFSLVPTSLRLLDFAGHNGPYSPGPYFPLIALTLTLLSSTRLCRIYRETPIVNEAG